MQERMDVPASKECEWDVERVRDFLRSEELFPVRSLLYVGLEPTNVPGMVFSARIPHPSPATEGKFNSISLPRFVGLVHDMPA